MPVEKCLYFDKEIAQELQVSCPGTKGGASCGGQLSFCTYIEKYRSGTDLPEELELSFQSTSQTIGSL